MKLVLDANILFAALIKNSKTADLLLHEDIQLFAPEFLVEEFRKYKRYLREKTKRTDKDFEAFYDFMERQITFVPKQEFAHVLQEARIISPDSKDVPYLALAIYKKIGIWSNDRQLKEGQDRVIVHNTKDMGEMLYDS